MGSRNAFILTILSIAPAACLPPELNELESKQSILSSLACNIANVCLTSKSSNQSAPPSFSPPPNLYNFDQSVTLISSAATICYTINGVSPTCDSMAMCVAPATTYTVPISLTTENIFSIQAIGCDVGKPESNISVATYSIDKTAPASVSFLSIAPNPASHSASLSWSNPTDSDLHAIRVLRKTNNYSIDETDGTIVTDSLTSTINDTALSLGTRYFYSVYAYDNANNFSVVAMASTILFDSNNCEDTDNCIIFVTNASYTGTFATPATADGYCNIDYNRPNGSNYKAMIAFPAVRFPCKGANDCTSAGDTTSMSDWVLYPNQNYIRPDDTLIGTTNSSGTFNSLTNAVDPSTQYAWTGLISGWALNAAPKFTCLNWTDSSQSGAIGQPNSSNVNTMMYFNINSCSAQMKIYCAEQ